MKSQLIYNYLNDDELLRISNKIKQVEAATSGEVCVSIKEKKSLLKRKKTVRQFAEEEFFRIGINNTKDKTGTLILIILKEREFYILADEGINSIVHPDTWNYIKDKMQEMFSLGNFCKGIIYGVEEVGNILIKHFPIKPDDTNELSNRVII